ncbi:META domain-containing protein [Mangrovibacterium diazotrophicum]|uniref:Heat shock protein HslJ n=1 Tax=Mangrovibacterium diazotrophicum TaxID=1261403 RepID=A0A419W759_9BACT|nr:META domain-containing protein [Mangrovibacterium diazotrophicum]RKD91304.1 heat shock protein HslJ [Mangrovibacterium diazotrophicum]
MIRIFIFMLLVALTAISCKHGEKLTKAEQSQQATIVELSQLQGQWLLKTIDDEPIQMPEQKEAFLEFHSTESRFSGYAGCNRFGGQVEMTNSELSVGMIMATKMYCPGIDLESRLMAMLQKSSWKVNLLNDVLVLKNEQHSIELQRK